MKEAKRREDFRVRIFVSVRKYDYNDEPMYLRITISQRKKTIEHIFKVYVIPSAHNRIL